MIDRRVCIAVGMQEDRVQEQPEMVARRRSGGRRSRRSKPRDDQQRGDQANGSELTGRDQLPR